MKSNKFVILLIIVGAAVTHAERFNYTEIDLKGSCPKIKYINNFNFPRIVGWYFEAFASLSSPKCFNKNEGLTMYAAPYDDESLTINFCCRSAATPNTATCGPEVGSGIVKVTSTPGEMTYEFNNKNKFYYIYVLDTDYENFTIVYGCNPRGRERDELILIHSRHYKLSNALEHRIRKVVQQNGGDWSNAKPIRQGPTIPYTPNSPKSRLISGCGRGCD